MLRQTSLMAFYSLNLQKREYEVLSVISQFQPIDNLSISKILHLPINCVTGRTRGLFKKDLVYEHDTITSQYTGRKVIRWGADL